MIIGIFFWVAAITSVASMLLSILWHNVDKRTDSIWEQRRRLNELRMRTPHPSEAAEYDEEMAALEADIARKHRLIVRTKWIRPIGVALLYVSLLVFAMAAVMAGVHYFR